MSCLSKFLTQHTDLSDAISQLTMSFEAVLSSKLKSQEEELARCKSSFESQLQRCVRIHEQTLLHCKETHLEIQRVKDNKIALLQSQLQQKTSSNHQSEQQTTHFNSFVSENNHKREQLIRKYQLEIKNLNDSLAEGKKQLDQIKMKYNQLRKEKQKKINVCNHKGIIQQYQKGMKIKDQKIEEMGKKLNQWRQFIGINKNIQNRIKEMEELSKNIKEKHIMKQSNKNK